MFPSTTHRACAIHFTFGPISFVIAQPFLFDVARFPSKTPARAAIQEPVQIVRRYLRVGYVRLTNSSKGSRSSARTPYPPGIISTSRGGALVKSCVGITDSPKFDLKGFREGSRGLVETGSRVRAMMLRFIGKLRDSRLRTSSGPNASSA
ncbi:hypothetical protein HHX47_DHR6000160 [Lentinula edodes]|nr:hypothetical protein HHX47_DHR6000160 [Lentinula edodes]